MRSFERDRNGQKIPLHLERDCLEGMIRLYEDRIPELESLYEYILRYPQLFETKTPAEAMKYILEMNEKFRDNYQAELVEVANEEWAEVPNAEVTVHP